MHGRYVRTVARGERWDPTMTGVEDAAVFRPGDYVQSRNGYALILQSEYIDARTRLLHLAPMEQHRPGAILHDLRESDTRNFYCNGMMRDGRAPADVMTFDEARRLWEEALGNAA